MACCPPAALPENPVLLGQQPHMQYAICRSRSRGRCRNPLNSDRRKVVKAVDVVKEAETRVFVATEYECSIRKDSEDRSGVETSKGVGRISKRRERGRREESS
jgi:hypothetical protein